MHFTETESHRHGKVGLAIVLLYDELERRSWSSRTRRGDMELVILEDLAKAAGKIDDQILARSRRVQYLLQSGGQVLTKEFGLQAKSS